MPDPRIPLSAIDDTPPAPILLLLRDGSAVEIQRANAIVFTGNDWKDRIHIGPRYQNTNDLRIGSEFKRPC